MDHRREPRFRAGQSITITLLGVNDIQVGAQVTNYSSSGLGVELAVPVEPGTAIKIRLENAIVLGEAVYLRQEGDRYYAGLHLDQTVTGLSELARIVQAFERSEPQISDALCDRRQQDQP